MFAIGSRRGTIFLVVAAISSIAVSFVFGIFIGNTIPGPNVFSPDTLSSWVTAAATVVITVLTFILAVETWRLRAAQTEQITDLRRESIQPNVSLALANNPAGIHFMDAKVSNNGKGIAKNIRFIFLNRDGSTATIDDQPIIPIFKKLAMIDRGVESLGVGQELSSFVFSFLDLARDTGQDIFAPYLSIQIAYEDVEGRPYSNLFSIDFIQYKGISKIGGGDMEKISSEIKDFRKAFERVSTTNHRVAVDVFNSTDRDREEEQSRIWQEQRTRPTE